MRQNTIDLFCWIPLASMIHAAYQAMISLIAARKIHSEIDGMANANALCSYGFTTLSKPVPVIFLLLRYFPQPEFYFNNYEISMLKSLSAASFSEQSRSFER